MMCTFRFNLKNLCFHEKDFDLKAEWHFFGTAHGKGTCDGVGGTVKRVIRRLALQRPQDNQIVTAEDMYKVAMQSIKNIRYIIIQMFILILRQLNNPNFVVGSYTFQQVKFKIY